MTPLARRPRLQHVPVRLRVSVDPQAWAETHGVRPTRELVAESVRATVADAVRRVPGVVDARRDQL